jgi:acyl carrier protein
MDRQTAQKVVVSVLEKHVPGLEVTAEKMSENLSDLGVDSLETMIVMMEISEATSVEIGDDEADRLNTPEKIVEFVCQ